MSYARVYGQPLDDVVRERWARRLPILLDGTRSSLEVEMALPRDPTHLLTRETVEDLCGGGQGWFARRLAENSVGDVGTSAPVRFYVGGRDVDAPAEDAHRAAGRLRAHGARAQVVHVGAVDHRGTALVAVGLTREWFDEVLGGGAAVAGGSVAGAGGSVAGAAGPVNGAGGSVAGADDAVDGVGGSGAGDRARAARTSRLRSVRSVHLPAHLPAVHLPAHLPFDRFRTRSA
jgi:hypothetical protein